MASQRRMTTTLPDASARPTSGDHGRPGTFADLGLPAALVEVLTAAGVVTPFPIQSATLPDSLLGRNVLGRGQTGSGKTYAFVLPLLARLADADTSARPSRPRALILAPTRELASQIDAAMAPLAAALRLTHMTIFGGVSIGPQAKRLRSGVDVVVACPGRLEDHLRSGNVHLDQVQITVLDEADHMTDLGFLPAVRRILDQTPRRAQRMLFSATLDRQVASLVERFVSNPITHSVDPARSPVSTMAHHVLQVRHADRLPVLVELTAAPQRTLVFTRTKSHAKRLTGQLVAAGVPAVELHGNLAQRARERNLDAFANGTAKTLVATDIAARGIHVDDIALVIHADPPVEHKAYLHRSGRTARAGNDGIVITLMTDVQVDDVRTLLRKAAIKATTTKVAPGDPLLVRLAPGTRTFSARGPLTRPSTERPPAGGGRNRRRQGAAPAPRGGSQRSAGAAAPHRPARRSNTSGRSGGAAAFSAGARSDRRRAR